MSLKLLILILCSVAMSAMAQILLKAGMSSATVQQSMSSGSWVTVLGTAASSLQVVGGMALYALGAIVWLLVLAKVDVSFAYPFVGLGFILTMFFGWLLLQESVDATRAIGTLLVAAGVFLVSRS